MFKLLRVLATGSAFFLFGIGALILSLLIFPLQRLLYQNIKRRQRVAKATVHYTFKFFVNYMQWVGVLRVDLHNAERLKQAKGCLVIANHPSLIDVVVLISQMRNADCVVKSALWQNPFIRGVLANTGYLNNDKAPEQFFAECKQSFADGNNLIIFPEGTRTCPGQELIFKRGAANIALRTGSHYQPVLIYVKPTTLTKGQKWYQVPDARVVFTLVAMPGIEVEQNIDDGALSKRVRQSTRELQRYFQQELKANESTYG